MNRFEGKIAKIESQGSLSIVSVEMPRGQILKSVIIDTPQTADYLSEKRAVSVLFKETEVILGNSLQCPLSISNHFSAKVQEIDRGQLLSRVELGTKMGLCVALIPSESISILNLSLERDIFAFVKINDILLSP